MPFTASTKRMAEEFLEAQEYKGHFSAGDLYSSLDKILSATVRDNELHTAILITDGNSLLDGKKQQKAINQWMQRNNGKVNLYTAAVGKDNNLIMLDLLSSCNRGKLLYSETHASFPRKLAKLVLSLREPLAKDLALTVIPNDPHANIKFFPADAKLPALFKKRPMTLLGTIDRLCNFNIYLQGKQKKSPLNIKIPVSFEEARKGSKNLEKLWALYEVNTYYDKFLKEGRSAHLKKAKQLLKDAGGEIAFE
jgi:hypothetical protein